MFKGQHILKRYSITIWIRLYGELLTSVTGGMLAPFLILYLHAKLHGSVLLPMMVVGLQPLSDLIFTFSFGGITDKIGRRKAILIALILQSSAMTGFMFAGSVATFSALYMLNGIGRSLYIPAMRAQIADSTDSKKRAEVFSLINTISAIGATLGPLLGFIVYAFHPSIIFAFDAFALLSYFFVIFFKMPETAALGGMIDKTALKTQKRLSMRQFITTYRSILGLMVFSLPISYFYAQIETNYRYYAMDLFKNYLVILSTMTTIKAVMSIFLELPLVSLTRSFSIQKVNFISYTFYAIAAIGYGFSNTLWMLILTMLIHTIAESIGLNHMLKFVSELSNETNRGRSYAFYGIHWDISRTTGPYIGGMIFTHLGGRFLFVVIAIFIIFGGIGQMLFVSRIKDTTKTAPTLLNSNPRKANS